MQKEPDFKLVKRYANAIVLNEQDSEDIAQDYLLSQHLGQKRSIKQVAIDHLRKKYGETRRSSKRVFHNMNLENILFTEIPPLVLNLNKIDEAMFRMYARGMLCEEIGYIFIMSDYRVRQRINKIKKYLKTGDYKYIGYSPKEKKEKVVIKIVEKKCIVYKDLNVGKMISIDDYLSDTIRSGWARGMGQEEISKIIGVSVRTLRAHIARLGLIKKDFIC